MKNLSFDLSTPITKDPDFEIRSRIAVDRAPIAPFRKLEKGFDVSTIPSAYLNPPLSISTITRAMISRIDSTIETEPLIVTDIARTGPDADFTASITTIASLASAIVSENPISVPFYKIEDNIYFDEPIHNQYNPWAPLFQVNGFSIPPTKALDITNLSKIASHAIKEDQEDEWFGALKDGLEISERVNQRFYRETEKLLPKLTEQFSRSFECTSVSQKLSVHVGTNSIICSVDGGKPCILEYSEGDDNKPMAIQRNNQWYIEAVLSACPRIIYSSSENGKITRFDEIEAPVTLSIEAVFKFLEFIRSNVSNESGLFIIHKNEGDKEIQIVKVDDEKLKQTGLKDLYEHRYATLEMFIGFRRSLSTNTSIIDSAHRLLTHAAQVLEPVNSALCLERIADSIILPILLLNRYASLIAKPLIKDELSESELNEAENLYKAVLEKEGIPERLIQSVKEKLATITIHKAQMLLKDEIAQEAIDKANMLEQTKETKSFICQCFVWRGKNAINKADIDKALEFAQKAKEMQKTDEDAALVSKLFADYGSAYGQILLSEGKIEEASELFEKAHQFFISSKSNEDIALSNANLAHIERQRAMKCTIDNQGKFTVEEERHLNKARDLYKEAIKVAVKKEHKQSMTIDLASLYVSVIIRLTQAPPVDRMPGGKIFEFVDSTIAAAKAILDKMPQNLQAIKQTAALDVWSARFNAYIRLPSIKSPEQAKRVFYSAINALDRARMFFIPDTYPADFVSITMTKAELYSNSNATKEALNELLLVLKVFRPTTVCLIGPAASKQQQHDAVNNLLPELVEITRMVLKGVLKELMEKKKNTDVAKDAFSLALKATPATIVDAIIRAQSIKL